MIDHEMITKYLNADAGPARPQSPPIYYIAGPPAMVAALRSMLNEAGVDDDDIRTEDFTGY